MTIKEKLNKRREILDAYEQSIGLPDHTPPGEENELQTYLSMDRKQIEALDAESAVSVSYRLSQFSFYFQRTINRERANLAWAKGEFKKVVAPHLQQYTQYTANKEELVCRENEVARELKNIMNFAEQRIIRIEELSSALKSLSFVIGNMVKVRLGERNG